MKKQPKAFFITGTGTDVGKTVITAGIAALGLNMGKSVGIMKPVQTGIPDYAPDLETIYSLAPGTDLLPEDLAMPYCFKLPASPHLAAKLENVKIQPARIEKAFNKAMKHDIDLLLIEGAGGINVPLTEDYLTLDLIKSLNLKVIVTALSGLGTINHTLLTINALKQRKIAIAGIIFNKMPLKPGAVEKDNIRIIKKISKVPILGVIREMNNINCQETKELLSEFEQQKQLKELLSF